MRLKRRRFEFGGEIDKVIKNNGWKGRPENLRVCVVKGLDWATTRHNFRDGSRAIE
jgi:hypothetical protein